MAWKFAAVIVGVVAVSAVAMGRTSPNTYRGVKLGQLPSRENLMRQIGGSGADDKTTLRNMNAFAESVKQRYRSQDLAVAVRFPCTYGMDVICSSNMSRWDMSRIALEIAADAQALFQRELRVGVRESYIGIPSIEIATVFHLPAGGRRVLFHRADPTAE